MNRNLLGVNQVSLAVWFFDYEVVEYKGWSELPGKRSGFEANLALQTFLERSQNFFTLRIDVQQVRQEKSYAGDKCDD